MVKTHSFHIPVMGIGFTIDTPLKVSSYGMDSVISIVDHILLEKMRKMYCGKYSLPYQEITEKVEDYRAKRITSYLNLIKELVDKKFDELKNVASDKGKGIREYLKMLPDSKAYKQEFDKLTSKNFNLKEIKEWMKDKLSLGSIDVNIMTKVDKENYIKKEKLPTEFNDAHSALRGYALSELSSSLILSAGMNPRLYSYIENFEDFYPNEDGKIKKKIVLKVSDYRSALIQGKFLAKKGLWVSEYRIESGLNCGGHAFATEGHLMGPILAEFKEKRHELIESVHDIVINALTSKGKTLPSKELTLKITAQGGVGTSKEHDLLLNEYNLDSVGWGSPFLLVPEATSVDPLTLDKLKKAKEKDLYLSNVSPLGVPFNNLRGNTKDNEKSAWIEQGRPGSSCPKKFLSLNKEFTEKPICTASRQYQFLKLKDLQSKGLSDEEFKKEELKIEDKSCICVGLGTSALLINDISTKTEGKGVSVCPGPNMAYFSEEMSLEDMTNHIYGKEEDAVQVRADRPHMFVKELDLYIDYFKGRLEELATPIADKTKKVQLKFTQNLIQGIEYYIHLFQDSNALSTEEKAKFEADFIERKFILKELELRIETMK